MHKSWINRLKRISSWQHGLDDSNEDNKDTYLAYGCDLHIRNLPKMLVEKKNSFANNPIFVLTAVIALFVLLCLNH